MKIAPYSARNRFFALFLALFTVPLLAMELQDEVSPDEEQDKPFVLSEDAAKAPGRFITVVQPPYLSDSGNDDISGEDADFQSFEEDDEDEQPSKLRNSQLVPVRQEKGEDTSSERTEPIIPQPTPVQPASFFAGVGAFFNSMRPGYRGPQHAVQQDGRLLELPAPGQPDGQIVPHQQRPKDASAAGFPLLVAEPGQPQQQQLPTADPNQRTLATVNLLGFDILKVNVNSQNLNDTVGGAAQTGARSAVVGAAQAGAPVVDALRDQVPGMVYNATRAATHGVVQGGTEAMQNMLGNQAGAPPAKTQPARVLELNDQGEEVPLAPATEGQPSGSGENSGNPLIDIGTIGAGVKKLAKAAGEGAREGLEGDGPLWKRIMPSKTNLIIGGTIAAGLIILGVIAYKYFTHRLDKHLNKPKLTFTLTHPEPYFIESGEKEPWFKGMVFAPDVKERLNEILITTGKIHQRVQDGEPTATYRNYLFYGPPDSDQHRFVQQLAQYAQMDLYELHASSLTIDDADAKAAVEEFFKNEAGKSLNGALVYLDDASALLASDGSDGPNQSKMVAAFIEAVKRPNNKFMLIIGLPTKPRTIDRRIDAFLHEWVEIKLPDIEERVKALRNAKKKYLLADEDPNPAFIQSVEKQLNENKIREIALKLKNATIGALFRLMETIKARSASSEMITAELVDQAVNDLMSRIPTN